MVVLVSLVSLVVFENMLVVILVVGADVVVIGQILWSIMSLTII